MAFSIDLRSDTVTRPSAAMRRAMLEAEVGDDVIDIDPTVERLQELSAELLGKPAALFMPSGTMANQIALRLHCRPGDEFLCDSECHIVHYEQGAFAQLSGLVARSVVGQHGILQLEQLTELIRPPADHMLNTRLVCLENTHNRGGGTIQPLANIRAICAWAHDQGLATHCDGARLMNAVVATGIPAARWSECFDSVSLCFSKGLGAPVGSVLAGSQEFIRQARRARKLFGGGMRQVGLLAAAAIFALEHNVARLADDHAHASLLGQAIAQIPGLALQNSHIETNMVIFNIDPAWGTAAEFAAQLAELDVGAFPFGPQAIRLVTHLDIGRQQALDAADIIRRVAMSKLDV